MAVRPAEDMDPDSHAEIEKIAGVMMNSLALVGERIEHSALTNAVTSILAHLIAAVPDEEERKRLLEGHIECLRLSVATLIENGQTNVSVEEITNTLN